MKNHFYPKRQIIYNETAIFAGNSRIAINSNDTITIEPQIMAFKAALLRATEINKSSSLPSYISVAFDYKGVFDKRLLQSGLTNSQRRHPLLSQLRSEITTIFEPIAAEANISLDEIHVIREDQAKSHANHLIDKKLCSDHASGIMTANNGVTCAAIVYEYLNKSITAQTKTLEIFYENDLWSRAVNFAKGVLLLEELGQKVFTELFLTDKISGDVTSVLKRAPD